VTGSYFHHVTAGHLLRSRARVNHILYNRFADEGGGRASYELSFPNRGWVRLVGNLVQQLPDIENSTLVSSGEEGYHWRDNQLLMGGSTLVNDHPDGGSFVRVAPCASRVLSTNNLLVGPGGWRVRDPLVNFNEVRAGWGTLARPLRYDYRLAGKDAALRYRQPRGVEAVEVLVPTAEYLHPLSIRALDHASQWVGAHPGGANLTKSPR